MNVWVEQGDVLFYLSRSGSFDENNTLLKQGRFRISLSPGLDEQSFRQILHLKEGYVEVTDGRISIQIWADVKKPVVHVDIENKKEALNIVTTYENWRTRDILMTKREAFQSSYKFAAPKGLQTHHDSIVAATSAITFLHRNGEETIFDATVEQQQMQSVKDKLYNPLKNLTFGGRMKGEGLVFVDTISGHYASSDYKGWMFATDRPRKKLQVQITLATTQGDIVKHTEKNENTRAFRCAT